MIDFRSCWMQPHPYSSKAVICSSSMSVPTLSSSTTHCIWSFLMPYPTRTSLEEPQTKPSAWMLLTHSSSFAISVSSSQGFTSNKMEDLATSAGSCVCHTHAHFLLCWERGVELCDSFFPTVCDGVFKLIILKFILGTYWRVNIWVLRGQISNFKKG